jgi:hypothetical protein
MISARPALRFALDTAVRLINRRTEPQVKLH